MMRMCFLQVICNDFKAFILVLCLSISYPFEGASVCKSLYKDLQTNGCSEKLCSFSGSYLLNIVFPTFVVYSRILKNPNPQKGRK